MSIDSYESPLGSRYASREMSSLFSPKYRAILFRKLWLALASAQKKLGLSISDAQIAEMQKQISNISFEKIKEHEKRLRHDVMAHIYAFGEQCPTAKAIIHLGATSTYVTDNADLIQLKDSLHLLLQKMTLAIRSLKTFAKSHANEACLGFTHYQAAQPTTVGKRACLWLQDLLTDALELERLHKNLPFLGAKGATGTQASFLTLFHQDEKKVKELEQILAKEFGFTSVLSICGQTYPRKIDLQILQALASFGASIHKLGTDLRLLAHDGELREAFEKSQVGSSAMPYKRNPIYAERLCGLSRFLMSLVQNASETLATQWLERSLDDSSNRRLAIPEALLTADALLNILVPLIGHLQVDTAIIKKQLEEHLPHLAMENILMAAVQKGGNRQELHEKMRTSSKMAPEKLAKDPAFHLNPEEVRSLTDLKSLIGRAPSQVKEFLKEEVDPFLHRYANVAISLPPLEL